MRSVKVNLKTEYEIVISKGSKDINKVLEKLSGDKVAIITDSNVNKLYGDYFSSLLENKKVYKYIVRSGEKSKNTKNYIRLLERLEKDKFSRYDSVIAFGGGMIGDLAGFVSATYMRGITLITVPTTLLSMIDSSVGGKTAINGKQGKNIFGTFYQPSGVYIDLDFLTTLKSNQIKSGLGEGVKYKYLCDDISSSDLFGDYESLIYKCLSYKSDIVEKDERESGIRKALNFGHTFGHAIESLSKMTIPHGLCVAKGIAFSLAISEKIYNYNGKLKEYLALANSLGLEVSTSFSVDKIINEIIYDKKRSEENITLTLIDSENKVVFNKIKIQDLTKYLG